MNQGGYRPRVNGALLSEFVGADVVLLGIAHDVDDSGTSFQIKACDGMEIKIILNEPLSDYVNGLTEVHGRVQKDQTLVCDNYIILPEKKPGTFDMDQYNKTVELTHQLKDHYITGLPTETMQ